MRSGSLVREARRRAGLTQEQLAERAGTTQSAVARWEAGRAAPSLETLARIVRACELELRVGLAAPDAGEASLIERNLGLPPAQRFDQLVRTVRFLRAGRAAVSRSRRRPRRARRG